jgi:hypothetical protein
MITQRIVFLMSLAGVTVAGACSSSAGSHSSGSAPPANGEVLRRSVRR